MHFEQINCFLTLGKYLNFTKTAKVLYTTQPTVSRQIRLLEKTLGFDLIQRDTTPLRLTPAGEYLYPRFKDAYEMIDTSIREVNDMIFGQSGCLRISCLTSLDLDNILTDIFTQFQTRYPKVAFSFEKHGFEQLSSQLLKQETDLVITLEPKTYMLHDNTEQKFLFDCTGVCLYSKDHPIAATKPRTLSDFRNETFICLTESASHRRLSGIYKICSDYGFSCKNIIRVPNIESVFFYVKSCQGVAILDKSVHKIHDDSFKFIDTPVSSATLSAIAVWNKENNSPVLHAFLSMLVTHIEKYQEMFR